MPGTSGLNQFLNSFNLGAAFDTFFSRKIKQYIGELLDGIGEEQLLEFIREDQNILDYLPLEQGMNLKMMVFPAVKFVRDMQIEFIYYNIPENYRILFESTPNGTRWILIQLAQIKTFLTS